MKAFLFPSVRAINGAVLALCLPFTASAEECVLAVNEPVVDFGQTQRAQLLEGTSKRQRLLVGTRVISLNLSCSASTSMALSFNGERADDQGYRFAQHGVFTLKVLSAQLDGKPIRLMVRDGGEGAVESDQRLRPGASLVPGNLGQIARGSKLSAQVEVKTYVDERDTEARSREQWSGDGQFSIDTF